LIGVDSNVLLRLVLADDPRQHRAAQAFIDARTASDPVYISNMVIAEFMWVLQRTYKLERSVVVELVAGFLDTDDAVFADRTTLSAFVEKARSNTKAGLADLFVSLSGKTYGCGHTVTFDRQAARTVDGMELLK
jgi:predicted nucleic-acid-binding protein